MLRRPVVAGRFYSGSAAALKAEVEKYIKPCEAKKKVLGVVSPHAGYVYSGPVAGDLFSQIVVPGTAVILAPNHTGVGADFALWSSGHWRTPLGDVEVDEELADRLYTSCDLLEEDADAHHGEHSAEVQVPFLQYFNPGVRIVGIVIRSHKLDELKELGQRLADGVKALRPDALIVASSDMTHYEPVAAAKQKDDLAIHKILGLDEDGLWHTVMKHRISMCGFAPTVAMLAACKALGAKKATLTKYQTSGDVSGDYDAVVGYAGVVVQ